MRTVLKIIGVYFTKMFRHTNDRVNLQIMKMIQKIISIAGILLFTGSIYAQHKPNDSLSPVREFVQLRQIYKHLPVELKIHVQNSANPVTTAGDSLQADMDIYYDYHNFYMKTEGLEEIVNDSLIVMVNNPAKNVLLYLNNQQLIVNMERSVIAIMPDSSIEALAKKYTSWISESGHDQKRIELKSREIAYGTNLPRESIIITYRASSHQPLEFRRTKTLLLPIDITTYNNLKKYPGYDGKLVSTSPSKGKLLFLVKELTTSYRFDKINYNVQLTPVKEDDRVIKKANGDYQTAKGFEEYLLTKEF